MLNQVGLSPVMNGTLGRSLSKQASPDSLGSPLPTKEGSEVTRSLVLGEPVSRVDLRGDQPAPQMFGLELVPSVWM